MKINRRQMLGILTVIVSRSPDARDATEMVIESIRRPPAEVQPLYNEAAARALSDQSAGFTKQEERLIRRLIAPEVQPRTISLNVRVTPAERQQLGKAARAAGYQYLSDYVRAMLGLPHTPPRPLPSPDDDCFRPM